MDKKHKTICLNNTARLMSVLYFSMISFNKISRFKKGVLENMLLLQHRLYICSAYIVVVYVAVHSLVQSDE